MDETVVVVVVVVLVLSIYKNSTYNLMSLASLTIDQLLAK